MDSAMNMNIDTLLEAAIFLEKRSATRGEDGDGASGNEEEGSNTSLSPGEDGKERRRAGGAGTREVHNKLEKNRRAHLKECFEQLKQQIPSLDDKRTSNLSILRCSLRYIQMLKRKEKEFEQEMQRLAREKLEAQERINTLKRELTALNLDVDIKLIMSQTHEGDTASVSTATADNESPIVSEVEDEDDAPQSAGGEDCGDDMAPKPHVPVTATIPAIQPPVTTLSPKQLAVNASTPIVLTSISQPTSQHVLAMPNARALTNMCKMVSGNGSSMVTLPPGAITSSANMASSQLMTAVAAATTLASPTTSTSSPTFKTPVNQILQQTLAQRALQHHLQQQQQVRQQQQQQPQPAPANTPKVITVQRPAVRPLTHLRQAVTVNHLMPSIIAPGASILTAPASLHASNQVAALAALTKIQTPTSSVASMSVAGTTASTQTSQSASGVTASSPAPSPAPVTFTTMKQFLTPSQLQGMVSLGATTSQIPAFGQLVTQNVGRTAVNPGTTTVNVAVTPVATPTNPGSSTVNVAVTPVPTTSVSSIASLTAAQAAHPVITSLAHMNPMTQLVSPMTMVSPTGIQVAPHLSQAQLSVVNSPILRSIGHIPIQLQQPINIGQIVKPVVMVTMPNVVTTSAPAATVQVQVPVTQS